ncbi:MAG: amino acid adenylation domain-containing protein [Iphinoe sp. HA4291-MV1]|jgi:amino acid adenylation domain-containing protein|nr:amino acid adenylation domain-containing protein [Iphinoe sp. HA4291-MV1]
MDTSTFEFLCQLRNLSINLETDGDRLRCHAAEGVLTPTLRQEIAKRKTEIISFLQEAKQVKVSDHLSIQPVPRDGELPLSFAQQRLWFVQQLSPDNDSYHMLKALRLDGSLNIIALEQSLSELVSRHEVLRTTFPTVDGKPIQLIAPPTALILPIHDLQGLSAEEQTDQIRQMAKSVASQPFDLAVGPLVQFTLLQLSPQEYVLLLKMHHIIYDGWSFNIFNRELSQLYEAFTQGLPYPLAKLPIQYADFAFWQRQWMTDIVLERQLNYWQQQLAGAPSVLELPTDKPRPPVQTFRGGAESFLLDHDLTQRLKQLSQESDATLFMTLLAAFLVLISRYSGQLDIVVGSPIANRNSPQIEQLMGFFANTLALRGDLSGNPSFRDFLAQVRQTTLSAYDHQDLPFEMLVEKLQPERDLSRNPLVQVIFALQNAPQSSGNLSGLNIQNMRLPIDVRARFDLEVHFWEVPEGLEGVWCYNTDLFDATIITRLAQHFQTLLKAIVANQEARIAELPLLSPAERHQLLVGWNSTQVDYPQDKSIHQLFEEQVERTPNAVAVVFEDEILTYHELNTKANQLAHHLQSLGVKPEVLVGLCLERSLEQVVGLLGILKAGGAYLPLDPAYPTERLAFLLENAKVSVILTQQYLLSEHFPKHKTKVISLNSDTEKIAQQSKENPTSGATPGNLAYVIYSSRQGILVDHCAIAHRLDWLQQTFAVSFADTVLHKAPLAQDTAVWEIFWPLIHGGRLIIAAANTQDDPIYLQHLIAKHKVSIVGFVPSVLSSFIESKSEDLTTHLNSLRLVLCGGEPLQRSVAEAFRAHFTARLYNLYSLPEAAGEVSCFACSQLGTQQTVPIGYPSYRPIYVLDQQLQPVPIGVKGEIYIGGTGLARGYLQVEEKTAQRFVKNPFQQTPDAYLFKTGELGRRLFDGTLELLDSSVRQTWIKGFRVELQEVEAALLAAPSVEDAWVLVRETETGSPQLVAYIVLSGAFNPEQLQSHLQALLPAYMLPCAYVPLSTLPLLATGQVDEQTLTRLEVIDSELVQKWEEQLRSLSEIEQVAVVVTEQVSRLPLLHISDLLPNCQVAAVERGESQAATRGEPGEAFNEKSGSNKPAISHGEPLRLPADAPTTLAQALVRAAKHSPTKEIVYIQSNGSEISQSYRDLLEEAQRILAGLRKLGLKPQSKVIFQLEQNQDFIPAFWGCVLGGFVPVPVAIAPTYSQDNSATRKLENAWHMLGRPIVLTSATQVEAIHSWSKGLKKENFQLITVDDLRTFEPDRNWQPCLPDDVALLVLTSGSTGIPKGVMLSHYNLLSRTAGSIQMNGFSSSDVGLNWMPLDHVAGIIYFHIRDVYLGCQQIQVPTQLVLQEPLRWLDWIEQNRVTITFAPNFAFGLINNHASEISQRHWDLSCLKFVLNGAESIVAKTARRFLELLAPHKLNPTAMHPAWGMAEVSSGVTYSNNFSLLSTDDDDSFVDVGAPIPGVSLRIVDSNNQVVCEDTIGSLQASGNTVMSGYYNNNEFNREVFTEDGWFTTGDLGFLHQGCLTITGRQKDIIIINGLNYYSHEIESAVEELSGVEVSFTAAVAVRGAFDHTDKLAIFFSSAIADEAEVVNLTKEIRSQVVQNIGVNPDYVVPVEKSAIPKTAIGKIQRQQLRKSFEAGEFNDILKQLDIRTGNANTLPDWFYRKIWRPKQAATDTNHLHTGSYLVFLDRLGLGKFICRELNRLNQPYITVEAGLNFAQLSHDSYCINPNEREHYRHLLESLKADNFRIAQILHLWTYDDYAGEVSSLEALEDAQQQGIYSLLFLIQALAKIQGSEHSVQLQVISSHAQFTSPGDKIAYEKSTLIGFLKTIPLELSWLQCRHIDLEVESFEVNAEHILRELGVAGSDSEIAYRNNQRLSSSVAKVDMLQQQTQDIPLKQGGIYLVSGGLGGIGTYLCQFLIKEYGAKLITVGRTELPDRTEWSKHLEGETRLAKRIKNYLSIEAAGGEFIYKAVDICDLDGLLDVVAHAESIWNEPLSGIIHLAGEENLEYHWKVIDEHWVTVETPQTFDSMLRPKVHGTWTLYQLIKNNPQAVFISFSSVNSVFGGATFSAYSAANSFLDCCSLYQRYHLHSQTYCFNWAQWDDLGMSQGNPEYARDAARGMGYYIISKEQGLSSLLAALYRNQAHLIVGLDDSNRNIQRYTDSKSYAIQTLTAYFTASNNDSSFASFTELMVRDRFGTKSNSDFVELQQIPLTNTGAIDREQLLTLDSQGRSGASKWVAPRTEIERQLASIWQQVLSVPQIGIHDNFFELGGHSLLATVLISRVQDVFQLELPLRCLFENPTVAQLSSVIVHRLVEQTDDDILAQLEELDDDQVKAMLKAENT